jgi:hypothetical protein
MGLGEPSNIHYRWCLCRSSTAFGQFSHCRKRHQFGQRQFAHHPDHHLESRLRDHLGARRQINHRGLPFIGSPQNPLRAATLLLFALFALIRGGLSSSFAPSASFAVKFRFLFCQLPVANCQVLRIYLRPLCVNLRPTPLAFPTLPLRPLRPLRLNPRSFSVPPW